VGAQDHYFESIHFSTTVHAEGATNSQSVEFVVRFTVIVCYDSYDCTGHNLIARSTVLINGERVSLDVQKTEDQLERSIEFRYIL
jgi:hypothetical protein